MEKKFEVVELTFIDENNNQICVNLKTGKVTPEDLDLDTKMNAQLRAGIFTGGGMKALEAF